MNKVYLTNWFINNAWSITNIFDTRDKALKFLKLSEKWGMRDENKKLIKYRIIEMDVQ